MLKLTWIFDCLTSALDNDSYPQMRDCWKVIVKENGYTVNNSHIIPSGNPSKEYLTSYLTDLLAEVKAELNLSQLDRVALEDCVWHEVTNFSLNPSVALKVVRYALNNELRVFIAYCSLMDMSRPKATEILNGKLEYIFQISYCKAC